MDSIQEGTNEGPTGTRRAEASKIWSCTSLTYRYCVQNKVIPIKINPLQNCRFSSEPDQNLIWYYMDENLIWYYKSIWYYENLIWYYMDKNYSLNIFTEIPFLCVYMQGASEKPISQTLNFEQNASQVKIRRKNTKAKKEVKTLHCQENNMFQQNSSWPIAKG